MTDHVTINHNGYNVQIPLKNKDQDKLIINLKNDHDTLIDIGNKVKTFWDSIVLVLIGCFINTDNKLEKIGKNYIVDFAEQNKNKATIDKINDTFTYIINPNKALKKDNETAPKNSPPLTNSKTHSPRPPLNGRQDALVSLNVTPQQPQHKNATLQTSQNIALPTQTAPSSSPPRSDSPRSSSPPPIPPSHSADVQPKKSKPSTSSKTGSNQQTPVTKTSEPPTNLKHAVTPESVRARQAIITTSTTKSETGTKGNLAPHPAYIKMLNDLKNNNQITGYCITKNHTITDQKGKPRIFIEIYRHMEPIKDVAVSAVKTDDTRSVNSLSTEDMTEFKNMLSKLGIKFVN